MMASTTATPFNGIEVRALVKRYHLQPVLDQLSLTINEGDFCILVGDNGAGKTTLLRILAGLVRPSQGEVTLSGLPNPSSPQLRRMIGFVGHQTMLYQDLTALENLHHYARLYHIEHLGKAVSQAIRALNLALVQDQPVRTLSRGMQQRLSLARAMLHNPSILLLDEPYTGLDQEAATFFDVLLQNLHQQGRTILLSAHRPQRLLQMASHVAWLRDGKIYKHVPIKDLHHVPELAAYVQEVS